MVTSHQEIPSRVSFIQEFHIFSVNSTHQLLLPLILTCFCRPRARLKNIVNIILYQMKLTRLLDKRVLLVSWKTLWIYRLPSNLFPSSTILYQNTLLFFFCHRVIRNSKKISKNVLVTFFACDLRIRLRCERKKILDFRKVWITFGKMLRAQNLCYIDRVLTHKAKLLFALYFRSSILNDYITFYI